MTTPTRRLTLSLAAALVLSSVAACGSSGSGDAEASSDEVAETRTVDDQYGEVTITGIPERVVTPGNMETDTALALGVVPVAMGQWLDEEDGASPWRRELLDGQQPELIKYNPDGFDVEETLAFQPDLVLAGYDLEENPYRKLSEVVPTVSMSYEVSGEELTRAIGTALGREDEAEDLIAQTEELLQAAAAEHPELDGTTIAVVDGSTPGVLYDATAMTLRYGMLPALGLEPAPGTTDLAEYAEVPAERWSTFDGDLLVVNFWEPGQQEKLESNELFQRIPAVKEGRYLPITDTNAGELLRSASLPQMQYALDHFVPGLAETAAG